MDDAAELPEASPPTPKRKRRPRPAIPCRRCQNIRWFILMAGPLLAFGLLDPVRTDSLLSRLPDFRQLVLWFPVVIVGTFLYRYVSWRRQQDR